MFPSIIIDNRAVAEVKGGQVWFPASCVVGRKPTQPGIVQLLDKKRKALGYAFCSPGEKIFLRVIGGSLNWRELIKKAYAKRAPLEKITNAYRVVFAESDYIPSVVIDKYNDVWVVQITSSGAETIRKELIEIITEEYHPKHITHNSSPITVSPTEIFEGSQKFIVDVAGGQKTGAYLDYRAIRLKASEFAKAKCLDAFCYQGWFACQIASKASEVLAVDSSEGALAIARKNAETNGHKNIKFLRADVFEFLKTCTEKFDFIHLDPPAMAKTRQNIKMATLGYKKLLEPALKLLNPDGIIMISSCSHHISERILEEIVTSVVKNTGRKFEIVYRGIQDSDHPVRQGFAESLYLKAVGVKCLNYTFLSLETT